MRKETKNSEVKKVGLAERAKQWINLHDECILFAFWIGMIFAAFYVQQWMYQLIVKKTFGWDKSEYKSYSKMLKALNREESVEVGKCIGRSVLDILRRFTES